MPLTIPNAVDAGFTLQAEPDSRDIDAIVQGFGGSVIQSGCAVTAQGVPNMTVAVSTGIVSSTGTVFNVTGANATIGAANATNPRFDLIVITSGGAIATRAGTAAVSPVFPTLTAGDVMLAAVYVPANATVINTNQIIDKRIMRGQGRLWVSDYGPTNLGSAGNLHLGAGGTSPNAASVAWGDGSGWKLNLGPVVANVFTPRFAFTDTGQLTITPATAVTGIGLVIGNFDVDASGRIALGGALQPQFLVNGTATHPDTSDTSLYGINMSVTYPSNATATGYNYASKVNLANAAFTMTTAYNYYADAPGFGASGTIGTLYGFLAANQGNAKVTNAFGIAVAAQSGATLNVAANLQGGTQANLWLNSDTASAAGGIAFGTTRDVSIFRGGAAALNLGGNLTIDTSGHVNLNSAALPAADRYVNIAGTHTGGVGALYTQVAAMTAPAAATTSYANYWAAITTVAAAFTLPQADNFLAAGLQTAMGAGSTVTNYVGFRALNHGGTNVVNAYGLLVAAQSGAGTLNIGASLGGGTQANLWLNNDTATAAGGIAFGTARDVSLYRQATLVIECSGTISAVTGFQVNHTAATAGTYLRGDGIRFVQASIAAGDLPTSGIPNVAYKNAANAFTVGGQTISTAAGTVGLTITGAASATAATMVINQGSSATGDLVTFQVGGTALGSYTAGGVMRQLGTATSTLEFATRVSTDTVDRWAQTADGGMAWGPGGSTATDTTLARSGVSQLTVGGSTGGELTLARGTLTQLFIGDRSATQDWVVYVSAGVLRLWPGADVVTVSAAGILTATGEIRAPNLDALRYMAVGP